MGQQNNQGTAATRLLEEWDCLDALSRGGPYNDPADVCRALAPLGARAAPFVYRWLTGRPEQPRSADGELLADLYPHPQRILTALRLSRDLETCRDLLAGRPVDPDRLDAHELFIAKNRKLVRLDMTALDDLEAA